MIYMVLYLTFQVKTLWHTVMGQNQLTLSKIFFLGISAISPRSHCTIIYNVRFSRSSLKNRKKIKLILTSTENSTNLTWAPISGPLIFVHKTHCILLTFDNNTSSHSGGIHFIFFSVTLKTKLRALSMLDKPSTGKLYMQNL